jgi:hypothetical protein
MTHFALASSSSLEALWAPALSTGLAFPPPVIVLASKSEERL